MPLLFAAIIGGLIQAAGTLVGRVLLSLGIGYISYQGITATVDYIKGVITSNLQGMPSDVVAIASLCQVDTAVSILISAIVVRFTLQGLTSGAMKKMVFK